MATTANLVLWSSWRFSSPCFILLASWFLLLSPVLTGAAEANASAAEQEQNNADTQVQVDKLRQQYAHLDEYQAELDALQIQIPTAPLYADLQKMFSDVAAKYGVVITTLQFGIAGTLTAAPPVDETAPTDGATPAPSATPDPTATADPGNGTPGGGAVATQGLYAIPVSVTMLGAYDNVMSALKELQTGTGRLVLVTDVTLTRDIVTNVGASSGVADADTTGVYAGSVFVLTSSTPTEANPNPDGISPSPSPSPTP